MNFVYKDGSLSKITKNALIEIIKRDQQKIQDEHYK